jgi:outer membrane protein
MMNPCTSPTTTRLVRSFALALALIGPASLMSAQAQAQPPAQPPVKIGLVDLKKVFDGYYRTRQADTQIKERAADFDKARKGMVEDYEKAKEEFEKLRDEASDQTLSAEERDKRRTSAEKKMVELRQIEQDVNQFDRTSRTTLAEQQRRMRDRILDEIKEVLTAKAREAGVTLVLDTAAETANQTPVVLFHTGQNDLSDLVLNELNSRGPIELPPAGAPTGTRSR